MKEGNNAAAYGIRTTHRENGLQVFVRGRGSAGPHQRAARHRASAKIGGYFLSVRCNAKINVPLQINWRIGHKIPPECKDPANVSLATKPSRERHGRKWMKSHFEFCHNAEVAAASAQSPEQVCVLA